MDTQHASEGKSPTLGISPSSGLMSHGVRVLAGVGLVLACAGIRPDGERDTRAAAPSTMESEAEESDAAAPRPEKRVAAYVGPAYAALAECSNSSCNIDGKSYGIYASGADSVVASGSMSAAVDFDKGLRAPTGLTTIDGNVAGIWAATPPQDARPAMLTWSGPTTAGYGQPQSPRTEALVPLIALNEVEKQPESMPALAPPYEVQRAPTVVQAEPTEVVALSPLTATNPGGRREVAMNRGPAEQDRPYEQAPRQSGPPFIAAPQSPYTLPPNPWPPFGDPDSPLRAPELNGPPIDELFRGPQDEPPGFDKAPPFRDPPIYGPYLTPITDPELNTPSALLAAVVPEPSTLALLTVALWGLAASSNSRRTKTTHQFNEFR